MKHVVLLQEVIGLFRDNSLVFGFSRKKMKPPVEDINGNFHGGRVKAIRIPGGMSKFEGKTRISKGVNEKKWKISRGCHDKIDWKSREVNFKKIDMMNRLKYNFFLEMPH